MERELRDYQNENGVLSPGLLACARGLLFQVGETLKEDFTSIEEAKKGIRAKCFRLFNLGTKYGKSIHRLVYRLVYSHIVVLYYTYS